MTRCFSLHHKNHYRISASQAQTALLSQHPTRAIVIATDSALLAYYYYY